MAEAHASVRSIQFASTTDSEGNNAQKDSAMARLIVDMLNPHEGLGSFLDVGCGAGSVLAAAEPFASTITGVDTSARFLSIARETLPQARLLAADVANLSQLADASFDTITFCDVIEHLENPVAALREIRRVLRPNGRLVITTPNADSILRFMLKDRWHGVSDASHILLFIRFTLALLLERSGFAVRAQTTLCGPSLPRLLKFAMSVTRQGGTLYAEATKR